MAIIRAQTIGALWYRRRRGRSASLHVVRGYIERHGRWLIGNGDEVGGQGARRADEIMDSASHVLSRPLSLRT